MIDLAVQGAIAIVILFIIVFVVSFFWGAVFDYEEHKHHGGCNCPRCRRARRGR
jgi:hypothetical protein